MCENIQDERLSSFPSCPRSRVTVDQKAVSGIVVSPVGEKAPATSASDEEMKAAKWTNLKF